jgi:trans-aconitate 2-methyltransferase
VLGVDSSPQMIAAARRALESARARAGAGAGDGIGPRFVLGDVRTWRPDRGIDVIVSNAVLQWVPGHQDLIGRWAGWLSSGGWLAFQVPGNFCQPTHQILRELTGSARWREELAGVALNRQTADPAEYLDQLGRAGCDVDAWETTYLHVLQGDNPVVEWYRGSGLRPVLTALPPDRAERFVAEYAELIRQAYPAGAYGTVLPFRRVFVVARRR